MAWQRPLAVAIAVLTAVVVVAGWLAFPDGPTSSLAWFAAAVGFGLVSTALGLLVAARHPANAVSVLLAINGLVACSLALPAQESDLEIALSQGAWMWFYVPLALLVLCYPDGRLPGPRWRVVAIALPAVAAVFTILASMDPNPFPAPHEDAGRPLGVLTPAWEAVAWALLPVFLGLLIACALSVRGRYRRADDVGRLRLRWLALAGLTVPLTLLLCWTSYLLMGDADLVVVGLGIMYLAIPVAAAIGLLRPERYDVDRAISAAAAYGLLSGFVLVVFTAVTAAGGVLLGRDSPLLAALAAGAAAVLLAPLRRWTQRAVDRRLSPRKQAARSALDDLRHRVHAGSGQPEELEAVLRAALRDPGLRVGYLLPGHGDLVDGNGAAVARDAATLVVLGGQEIGALAPSLPAGRFLLQEVAAASTLLVEVVRLRAGLGQALHDVEASRMRLVQSQDDERRRLQRDLHDGAQQRLVSLGMAIRIAQRHLDEPTLDVNGLLDETVAGLATAVAELRAIAHGIRPSALDEGLGPALASLTRGAPVAVDLDVVVGELPEEVSSTAYYVANEAVANAVKHANPGRIGLCVRQEDGHLRVTVTDDGQGGAVVLPGSGLAGINDRVDAVGGKVRIRSGAERGTVVEVVLPCGS